MATNKITDLEIPFYYVRKPGQSSIMIRIEGDTREQCESLLNNLEIIGDSSKYSLLRLDKYPREITACIVYNNNNNEESIE